MNTADSHQRGEIEFVRRLRTLLSRPAGEAASAPSVGFGDDMCTIQERDPALLWTVDMLMDGVDFDSSRHTWRTIGRKAMAVNLSDCAAMACAPVSALCAVSLANTLSMQDALDLMRGAHECGQHYDCPIVGGDTNSWDAPTAICITVAARCPPGEKAVTRHGAQPGDRVWLTGRVGGSILGRHMDFEPRIETALELQRRLHPHAMIDISDGLALDLSRILEASGCGAVLSEPLLDDAVHPDAERLAQQDGQPPRDHALYDGEDFELIVVLPADASETDCAQLDLIPIGHITPQPGLRLETGTGQPVSIPIRGWEHFR